MVDFLFVIIQLFRYLLRLRRYKRKSVEVGGFRSGVGHLECKFQTDGVVARQPLLVSDKQSDFPFVSYIKINIHSALFGFVTKHGCDGRTDRQTNGQTGRNTILKTVLT